DVQFNDTFIGASLIAFDYNRDGDIDMMQTTSGGPLRLLDNVPNGARGTNHYLVVRPRMAGTNHYAIGSVVRVTVGATTMMRPILAGTSMVGQEPAEAFFGLGSATVVDQVVVQYPNGERETLNNVAADQVITVTSGPPIPTASTWGALTMALLLMIAGTYAFRRVATNP
ncbi:MAG: ASPIC/UnbV domain-containing protein, partial [Planctomycetes bacterium]|nr:ASPIC/UnbV domain-containing protein [Planctomycetota bacterium]